MITLSFLELLFKLKPNNQQILIWLKNGETKISKYFSNADEAQGFALSKKDAFDVYFGVCTVSNEFADKSENVKHRASNETVIGCPALYVDLDYGDNHQKKNIPPTEQDAISLLSRMPIEPSIIVSSGNGLHAYWLLNKFFEIDSEEQRNVISNLNYTWQARLKELANKFDWSIDATHDLARVLRVVGTFNQKNIDDIKEVKLLQSTDKTYSIEQIKDALDGKILVKPNLNLTSDNSQINFVLSNNPTVNMAKFDMLCEEEARFKQSFERTRKDMSDASPSAYDLSLATFAYNAGWKDQEIVDLLIYSRKRNGDDLKLRVDYYQRTLAKARQEIASKFDEINTSDDKPMLNALDENYSRITPLAWKALIKSNESPRLFRFGNLLWRIESDTNKNPLLVELSQSRMTYELTQSAHWYKQNAKGEKLNATPPIRLVQNVLATPNIKLPILERIVTAPVFANDGTLQTSEGYNEKSRTYYHRSENFNLRAVPEKPTTEQIEDARSFITDRLLGDFPFVSEADKSHAVALMLLPFVRDLIKGSTPLHDIEAATIGSGKTILAKLLAIPSTPSPLIMTEARDEEEWRKRMTSGLRNSPSFVIIDNVRNRLESTALASLLTTNEWEDRLLGESAMLRLSVRAAFVVTANNPSFSDEMMRRSVRIRLDPKCDKAWLRENFAIPNIEDWAKQNRAELVWSALTLVQAWIAQDKPLFTKKKLGSYERWSEVIGGILSVANVNGFLENLNEFYEEADTEGEAWRYLVSEWWYRNGQKEVAVSNLWGISSNIETLDIGFGDDRSQRIRFGKKLSAMRDRQIGDFRIKRASDFRHAARWRLEYVGNDEPPLTIEQENNESSDFVASVNVMRNTHTH